MSTRRLILTALVCGLAILLAGGVQLWRVSRSDRTAEVFPLGTKVDVGAAVAVATRSQAADHEVTVDVVVTYRAEADRRTDPTGWAMLAGGDVIPPGDGTTCASSPSAPLEVGCHLVFPAPAGTRNLLFRLGDSQPVWHLP